MRLNVSCLFTRERKECLHIMKLQSTNHATRFKLSFMPFLKPVVCCCCVIGCHCSCLE